MLAMYSFDNPSYFSASLNSSVAKNDIPRRFAAYTPKTAESTPIGIRIGNYTIEVNPGFDPITFIEAIRLLKSL
jgi:hypothetical protein